MAKKIRKTWEETPIIRRMVLFRSLTKLFSGPITQEEHNTVDNLRRRHLDTYASRFNSASGKQFKKMEYNPMNIMTVNMISNRNQSRTLC